MIYFRVKHRDFHTDALQAALRDSLYADLAITPAPPTATLEPVAVDLSAPLDFAPKHLTEDQIREFLVNGVLVVEGILSPVELREANDGMTAQMQGLGVETLDGEIDLERLTTLSSTGGAGGVLDLFYPEWKLRATLLNEKYHAAYTDLLQATFGADGKCGGALWSHPHGNFDASAAYAHIDRVGYRVPDAVSTRTGRGRKGQPQRSLTPHLDCCPTALHAGGGKAFPRWRPIQCMLALTPTLKPNQGGFECVTGFHREFEQYYSGDKGKEAGVRGANPVCVGDFSPIQPKEDSAVIARFQHISVRSLFHCSALLRAAFHNVPGCD